MGFLNRFVFSWDRRKLLVETVIKLITFWMSTRNVLSKVFCLGKIKFAPGKARKQRMEKQRERTRVRKPRKANEMARRSPKTIPANLVERLHVDVPF